MKLLDIVAGFSVAGLILPEAIGYAGIAGLPPQHAIVAAIAGACAYVILGRSRFAIVAPTSSAAAILAATIGSLPLDSGGRAVTAAIIVALVGVIFCVLSFFRLGGLASFISRPVLRGFTFGLAITIIVKQLPIIFGQPPQRGNIGASLRALLDSAAHWNAASVVLAVVALALLLVLRRYRFIPGAFIVLAGSIVASTMLQLPAQGVAVVGTISLVPQWGGLRLPAFDDLLVLSQAALPIVMILFAESWGTMRTLALRHGDTIEPNRELGALGLSNIASSLVMGMPVGAGFSAGSAAEAAGAQTRWTALISAIAVGALVIFAMPLVALLPEPVLAAVVVAAVLHALDIGPFLRLWQIRRDLVVALGAAFGVLALGVRDGMLFAIALSLALVIRRLAAPNFAELGQLGTGHDYVDIAYHPDAHAPAGMAIFRPAEPLFFANAERVLAHVAAMLAARPDRHALVLSLEESFELDSTALDALIEFADLMERKRITLQLARVRDHVRDLMRQAGADDLLARSSYSVDDAVQILLTRME
jgi:MFS superfamily sulfate permease-like transporter